MELVLERMVHGGVALGRLPDGRIALVRGGIPGERVSADLAASAGVLSGRVSDVHEASPDRLATPRHPGLDYGHIRYPRQLTLKQEVVADAISRATGSADGDVTLSPVRPAPAIWRYRATVQPAVVPGGGIGYRAPGSTLVVPLADDPVAGHGLASAWRLLAETPPPKGVREVVMRGNDDGQVLMALVATSPARSLLPYAHALVRSGIAGVTYARYDRRGRFRAGHERLAGERRLRQRYGEHEISVTVSSFAQPNPGAASLLYAELAELAGTGGRAVDLFAGSGIVALHLASSFERVDAVEIDRGSVVRGREDAERLGVDNVSFHAADARGGALPDDAELVAVDPPRSGLAREVRELIDGSRMGRLVYVSCDVATWARDVADFLKRGWRVRFARPYDFYPHTHHVEMLSLLVR